MLVPFEEGVLHPEHNRVETEGQEDHDEDQLRLWVALEPDEQGGAEDEQLGMVDELDVKDGDLGDELADAPDS